MFYNALFQSLVAHNFAQHISEENDAYVIELALPGVKREELELSIENRGDADFLAIRVKPDSSRPKWQAGEQEKFFQLGRNLNSESIEARLENGVLNVRVAKKEVVKKTISVA